MILYRSSICLPPFSSSAASRSRPTIKAFRSSVRIDLRNENTFFFSAVEWMSVTILFVVVRTAEFRYIRNYSPHRPYGQHYSYPFQVLPSMRSWHDEFVAGRCNEAQAAYWKPKPAEELYRIADDPYEIHNLASDPRFAVELARLRATLQSEMLTTRDAGLIPERMFDELAGKRTIYDYAQSEAYPLARIIDIANKASDGDAARLNDFVAAMSDPHPVIRYWGATGCLILQQKAAPAKERLQAALRDALRDVRLVAAESLGYLGSKDEALKAVADVLKNGDQYEVLAAQNTLDAMGEHGHVALRDAQDLVRGPERKEPGDRIPKYLLELAQ